MRRTEVGLGAATHDGCFKHAVLGRRVDGSRRVGRGKDHRRPWRRHHGGAVRRGRKRRGDGQGISGHDVGLWHSDRRGGGCFAYHGGRDGHAFDPRCVGCYGGGGHCGDGGVSSRQVRWRACRLGRGRGHLHSDHRWGAFRRAIHGEGGVRDRDLGHVGGVGRSGHLKHRRRRDGGRRQSVRDESRHGVGHGLARALRLLLRSRHDDEVRGDCDARLPRARVAARRTVESRVSASVVGWGWGWG